MFSCVKPIPTEGPYLWVNTGICIAEGYLSQIWMATKWGTGLELAGILVTCLVAMTIAIYRRRRLFGLLV